MDYVISAESPSCSIASQQDETGELNRTSNSFFTVKYSAYKHTEYYRQTENSPIFYFTKGAVGVDGNFRWQYKDLVACL